MYAEINMRWDARQRVGSKVLREGRSEERVERRCFEDGGQREKRKKKEKVVGKQTR